MDIWLFSGPIMAITNHIARDILTHVSSCVNKFFENIPKSQIVGRRVCYILNFNG